MRVSCGAQDYQGPAMNDATAAGSDLIVRREGAMGVVRLNRPEVINALTLEMCLSIDAALSQFASDPDVAVVVLEGAGERGLCAGGDIRSLHESSKANGDLGKIFWRQEYTLNARIAKYPKPYIAFMDGLVMGGGVGLSAHGRHRIVTERTKLAMPEVGIGIFPDVGGTWLFSRAPGELGTYFSLTGLPMNGSDAIFAGLADAMVPSSKLSDLRNSLINLRPRRSCEEIGAEIERYTTRETFEDITSLKQQVDSWFAYDSLEEIVAALRTSGTDLASSTLKVLGKNSPRALKVTLRLLRLARLSSSLEQCLMREYRAALAAFRTDDFREGVRAAVIDKDRKPKWSPAFMEDVTSEMIEPYFAAIGADELTFPNGT